jgi:hypothetical protein
VQVCETVTPLPQVTVASRIGHAKRHLSDKIVDYQHRLFAGYQDVSMFGHAFERGTGTRPVPSAKNMARLRHLIALRDDVTRTQAAWNYLRISGRRS